MYEEYKIAGNGLKTMFIGEIVSLVGGILGLVPLVGSILQLVGGIMVVYGLYTCMKGHPLYKSAMLMAIVAVVLGAIGLAVKGGIGGGLVSILQAIVGYLKVNFICTATGQLLTEKGDSAEAARADKVKGLYLICTVIAVICTLVSWIPLINVLAAVAGAVGVIINVVAYILLLVLYNKASKSLLA